MTKQETKVAAARRAQLNQIIAGFGLGDYEKLEAAKAKWGGRKPAAKIDAKPSVKANNMIELSPAKPKLRDRVKKMFRPSSPSDLIDDFFKKH